MKQSDAPTKLSFLASYLIIAILVLLPFHALLTTWAGSNFNHLDAFRLWKEFLLVPLGLYGAVLVWRKKSLYQQWNRSWLVICSLLYALLFTGFAIKVLASGQVTTSAVLYSLVTNLRFLWFMLLVWAITDANPLIRRQWSKIVLAPAGLVIVFGLLQRFVWPADFLRHFGYGPKTIPAIETVDQKLGFRRIQSTLRGANPLGAYLILPLLAAGAYVRKQAYYWLFIAAGLVVLFFSYSRSAALGLVVALVFYGWHNLTNRQLRRQLFVAGLVAAVLAASGVWLLRGNSEVQNTLFHTDATSHSSLSSNAQRAAALRGGLRDIWHEPLGRGPGTAGPASVRNNGQARIAENYYLQIGQEVGLVGLGLFAAINLLIARELWRRTDALSRVLLASLVGITVVNLVSHAWADDTLSLLWWGLAGAALSAPGIISTSHGQKTKV